LNRSYKKHRLKLETLKAKNSAKRDYFQSPEEIKLSKIHFNNKENAKKFESNSHFWIDTEMKIDFENKKLIEKLRSISTNRNVTILNRIGNNIFIYLLGIQKRVIQNL